MMMMMMYRVINMRCYRTDAVNQTTQLHDALDFITVTEQNLLYANSVYKYQ